MIEPKYPISQRVYVDSHNHDYGLGIVIGMSWSMRTGVHYQVRRLEFLRTDWTGLREENLHPLSLFRRIQWQWVRFRAWRGKRRIAQNMASWVRWKMGEWV